MSESRLLHDVAEAFREATDRSALRSLLDQVEAAWDEITLRAPTPENAETCRLAMLVAAQLQETAKVRIWHARALTRFVQVGWAEGVASVACRKSFAGA